MPPYIMQLEHIYNIITYEITQHEVDLFTGKKTIEVLGAIHIYEGESKGEKGIKELKWGTVVVQTSND